MIPANKEDKTPKQSNPSAVGGNQLGVSFVQRRSMFDLDDPFASYNGTEEFPEEEDGHTSDLTYHGQPSDDFPALSGIPVDTPSQEQATLNEEQLTMVEKQTRITAEEPTTEATAAKKPKTVEKQTRVAEEPTAEATAAKKPTTTVEKQTRIAEELTTEAPAAKKPRRSAGKTTNNLSTSDPKAPARKRPAPRKFSASATTTQQSAQPEQPSMQANPSAYIQGRLAGLFDGGIPGMAGLMAPEITQPRPMPFSQFHSSFGSSIGHGGGMHDIETRVRIENMQLKREQAYLTQKNEQSVHEVISLRVEHRMLVEENKRLRAAAQMPPGDYSMCAL